MVFRCYWRRLTFLSTGTYTVTRARRTAPKGAPNADTAPAAELPGEAASPPGGISVRRRAAGFALAAAVLLPLLTVVLAAARSHLNLADFVLVYLVAVVAVDGTTGLAAVARDRPDVIILDLGLPDMDGTEVIHGVRGWTSIPIIVLSAWGQESQKVAALDAGADDYVTKPFGMDELLARLRAAVRRAAPAPDEPVVATADFTVDLAAKQVVRPDGSAVRLTPTEWQVLEILVRNSGRLVTQGQLLREVWGPAYETESNYLRVYLAQLRRKLEPEPSRPRHLLTESGGGYRFMP